VVSCYSTKKKRRELRGYPRTDHGKRTQSARGGVSPPESYSLWGKGEKRGGGGPDGKICARTGVLKGKSKKKTGRQQQGHELEGGPLMVPGRGEIGPQKWEKILISPQKREGKRSSEKEYGLTLKGIEKVVVMNR